MQDKNWFALPHGRRISARAHREYMEETFPVNSQERDVAFPEDEDWDDIVKQLKLVKAALARLKKQVEPLLNLEMAKFHASTGKLRSEAPPAITHSERDIWN